MFIKIISARSLFAGLLSTVLVLSMAACAPYQEVADPKERVSSQVNHVVVIGVDGLSTNGIVNAETPVLDRLMKEGAFTLTARGVLPTSSSTNWKSMVSGAGPEQHGVTSNGWERDDFSLSPITTGTENIFPTMFGELRTQRPETKIAAVYAWDGFGRLIERSALNYDIAGKSDLESIQLAADYFVKEQPELLFVHLDWVDHIGHADGHKTENYSEAVTQADEQIGMLIDAAESAELLNDTVFIITSDHGGIGYGHGGETLDEIQIPFIVYGGMVKSSHSIQEYVYTYDTAATVAYLLNIEPNPSWIGKPIFSAFEGVELSGLTTMDTQTSVSISAPTLLPSAYLYDPPGAFYLDQPARLEISNNVEGAQIRYTLDGSEPSIESALYEDVQELNTSAVVNARAFLGNQESAVVTGYYQVARSDSDNGIQYDYYESERWDFLPTFSSMQPLKSGTTYQFRINDINDRVSNFAIRYQAWLDIKIAGEHKFYTLSDDGSVLYIDDQEVVNNDGAHGTIERSGTIELEVGAHQIRVEYFNQAGGYWLEIFHKAPGSNKQLIAPELLYPGKPSAL